MKDTSISVCKGIAIILMVMGHAECPSHIGRFIYEFHMPLFFITSGYFFSLKYINDEATFLKKKIKGIYWPFVKWSFFFLIIHNFMFDLGVMNEQYGNASGGVAHPYTWHEMQQNLWSIITFMGGYDVFLAGAFWFFRALFVGSILYLVVFKLVYSLRLKEFDNLCGISKHQVTKTGIMVCVIMLLLCAWKTSERLTINSIAQGGYRDLMGCFFIGCGFLMQNRLNKIQPSWWLVALLFGIVLAFAEYAPSNMAWNATFLQFVKLPVPAISGFFMLYIISRKIDLHDTVLKRFLVFCGNNTLYVFIFHIISFKLVSIVKIIYYHLDWQQIGCHMVIHEHAKDDYFWIAYTIVGVAVPLLSYRVYERAKCFMYLYFHKVSK